MKKYYLSIETAGMAVRIDSDRLPDLARIVHEGTGAFMYEIWERFGRGKKTCYLRVLAGEKE